jgi:hypothetical protein
MGCRQILQPEWLLHSGQTLNLSLQQLLLKQYPKTCIRLGLLYLVAAVTALILLVVVVAVLPLELLMSSPVRFCQPLLLARPLALHH